MSTLPIPDWEMLVTRMDGELRTFDLRFVSSKSETMPTRSFNGHVGGLNPRSSIAVSSEGNYVFTAGDDGCVRGWSLRTSEVDPQITTGKYARRMCLSVANEGVEGFVGDQLWAAGVGESGRGIVSWCL
ncbi:wd-40 repeat-containing protein [Moniliophthora roreri MCA 2997]|nr:wd-40 repeat-containing protein [Moniliophthora roreri MCA 2997]